MPNTKKELLLAVLNQRLEKAKDERSSSTMSLLAYEAAKAKVKAYEEMITLIESGSFDQEEDDA